MESQAEAPKVRVRKRPKEWSRTKCKGCQKLMGLNAYELCAECRSKPCRECGKIFVVSKTLSVRCSPCQQSLRKRQRLVADL